MTLFPPKPVHVFVCIIDYYTNSICNIYTAKIEAQQQIKKKKIHPNTVESKDFVVALFSWSSWVPLIHN